MNTKKDDDDKKRKDEEAKRAAKAKAAPADAPHLQEPKPGSLDPGETVMANPGPQNVVIEPEPPTADPMATPRAAPLPNPPPRPGGDVTGEPNVDATGQKLPPDHPDYRKDYEGKHGPDHRTEEEKKANPRT